MSEGSGVIVMEELEHALKRNVRIYADILGYGATSDAYHMTRCLVDGEGIAKAMRLALQDAGTDAGLIDHINAHGTSTPLNDRAETLAIKKIFGPRAYNVPVTATKSMVGHTFGGAGAIELIASVLTLENQFIPPTINYEFPDPDCDLNYVPNKGIKSNVNIVLSNSLGFGSRNAALVIKRYKRQKLDR